MSMETAIASWTQGIAQRPEIYPHQLDLKAQRVLLVELSASQIANASFLDERVLTQDVKGIWVPWQAVKDNLPKPVIADKLDFIFHVGHCGSTLLSRLFGCAPDTVSLREPLPLRTIATDMADAVEGRAFLNEEEHLNWLHRFSALWSRGANNKIVKATSICTDLLSNVLSAETESKAIFIFNKPDVHIKTLLAGQNAAVDMKGFAQLRVQRLRQQTGLDIRLNELTLGKLAALSWLSETVRAAEVMNQHGSKILPLEFDTLLAQPADTLASAFSHVGYSAGNEVISRAVEGPIMRTYSKAPEHKYSAELRSNLLLQASNQFSEDIKEGMKWIEALGSQSTQVATALTKFAY